MDNNLSISNKFIVKEIIKKSQAKMFKNLNVGDSVEFRLDIKHVGSGSKGRTYAPGLKIINLKTKESTIKTLNELPKILENFKFESEDK